MSSNFTSITPQTADRIARAVKRVESLPVNARSVPTPFVSLGSLPAASGQYKVLQILDNNTPPAIGWDWPRAH